MTAPPNRAATILNVDDNDANRFAVSHVLAASGYEVREAATGREALRLAAESPDLILLDVNLPDVNGLDVCRQVKALGTIPVLLISGLSIDIKARVRGLDEGADGYLTKPIEPAELLAHVRALLRLKHAEESWRKMAAERDELLGRLRLHIERMPLAYVLLDANCRVIDWNPTAERLFGFRKEEILGLGPPYENFVPPSARPQTEEILRRIRAGDMAAHSVNDNLTREGQLITCEWFNTPLLTEDGRFTGILCLAQDVTGRRRLEEQLRQAQKMEAVGRLAGGIAHDFNNLLTVINGYSGLLLDALTGDDSRRDLAAEVLRAGERAAALTRQLLAFSRQQVVAPRLLDLNSVVADMEKMLRRVIGEDVELATSLQPGLRPIKADPGQVEQVLMNLAVNARDAMPQGGRLTIETRNVNLDESYVRVRPDVRPGPYVLLAVSDTGHGMTAEVKARLFEPFFTTKEAGLGTGLGLATVYGIVKHSGGHIEVYSEPGAGTTFKVYLPRAEGVGKPGRSYQGEMVSPQGSETILVAEDEEGVRSLICAVLRGQGYLVLEAGNGEEALALCERHEGPIDLLVTDVVMPGLGGRQLAERLAGLHPRCFPQVRVLYLSGYTDDAVVRHGVLHEQVHFLQKPFSPVALAQKVREVLDAGPAGTDGQRRGDTP
jgi:two-component system cell cycle sensor histidine kinase/response regulator CckA